MAGLIKRLVARLFVVVIVLQGAALAHPAIARVSDAPSANAGEARKPEHAVGPATATTSPTSPTAIMLLAGFGLMAFIARRRTRTPDDQDR